VKDRTRVATRIAQQRTIMLTQAAPETAAIKET